MSELKPCPFCNGEARIMLEEEDGQDDSFHNVYCTGCGAQFWVKSKSEAEQKWNRRAQPANEPLTLDELREMDGEPVWVTHKDGSGGRWGIVNSYKGAGMCADLDSYTAYWFDDWCGTIAYRRKPEGSKSDGL